MKQTPEHILRNRALWNADGEAYERRHAEQLSTGPQKWGVWGIPEADLNVLGNVNDRDVLELGCGAARWSISLAEGGARATGMDLSEVQLGHAQREVAKSRATVFLTQASAEDLPFRDDSFDLAFCDYGGMTFADPYRTVPEVARVLRAGGSFAFLSTTPFIMMCWPEVEGDPPPSQELKLDYFGMHRFEFSDSTDFQLPYGEWIRLFRHSGFVVEDLIEIRPDPDAVSSYRDEAHRDWARRWPAEQIWKLTKVEG